MKISYLVWFLLLSVVSWQDFQKQEISSWLLILMGSLGTGIQIFEGSVSLGAWFGGILLGAALLFLAFVTREEIGYGDGWLVLVMGMSLGLKFSFLSFLLAHADQTYTNNCQDRRKGSRLQKLQEKSGSVYICKAQDPGCYCCSYVGTKNNSHSL